jgi:CGNR zinc finger protein/putative stress-induced transcription regulator
LNYAHYTDVPVMLARDLVNLFNDEITFEQLNEFVVARGFTNSTVVKRRDLADVASLATNLRAVFLADDEDEKVDLINGLLAGSQVEPRLVDHDDDGVHFHYTSEEFPVLAKLRAYTAMGLAMVASQHDHGRLGSCVATGCKNVFVDTTRNASKRFCSAPCANRTNVASFRERKNSN